MESSGMKIWATFFGKTRLVNVSHLQNMSVNEEPDEILWVERGEDWYALSSPQLRDKKVAVISRDEWKKAGLEEIWDGRYLDEGSVC